MPVDAAFKPSVSLEDRAALLKHVLPGLPQGKARDTLLALEPDRWTAVRAEASRVLQRLEELGAPRQRRGDVRNQFRGSPPGPASPAPSRVSPSSCQPLFVVPNSSTSPGDDRPARPGCGGGDAGEPELDAAGPGHRRRGRPRSTPSTLETIEPFGINDGTPRRARLGGWLLLAALLVGLLLAWIWRFRREFWHRNNVLLLVGAACSCSRPSRSS